MNLTKFIMVAGLLVAPILAQAADEKPQAPATPVVVVVVEKKDFADEIEALGTLKSREGVNLASSVTEIVTKVNFKDNQRVKKGDILLEMDASEERAELAEQESSRAEAQRQVNRLSPLVKKGAASASILDENRRDLQGAQARIRAIQSRINQRVVKAPFDGVLGLRNVSVGALAQPDSIITTIDDDSIMKLDFAVPEIFLSALKTGVIIEAETEAYPGKIFKGEISNVDSRIDPITRSIQARAIIPNDEKLLKPGLLMQVELQKDPRKVILIPEEAITSVAKDTFVFVVSEKDGKTTAEKRKIKLGARQFGEAEILEGLEEGEKIVTHGTLRVKPGAPLKITAIDKGNESLDDLINSKKTESKKSEEEK